MKMIIAMVQDEDSGRLVSSLMTQGCRATKISTTGGFLRRGNSTLIVGVEDHQVDEVIATIRECCRKRKVLLNLDPGSAASPASETPMPILTQVEVGGAVVFVTDVERFERL